MPLNAPPPLFSTLCQYDIKHAWELLKGHLPPVNNLIRNAASLLPASLLSEGRAKLWALFKAQGSRRFLSVQKTSQKVSNQRIPSLTPSPPLPRHSTVLPQSFQRARQRSLPFPARVELRQLPALASSNPEREMQITALGTVNKVLRLTHS